MLSGYCLYKDGQLVAPPVEGQSPPNFQQPPNYQEQYGQEQGQQTLDKDGKCCPQASPISINITNSQDTNSRNVNTRRTAATPKGATPTRLLRQPRTVYVPRPVFVPRYQRVIQPVIQPMPYPVTRNVYRDVPRDVRVEVPVVRDTYTERTIRVPVRACSREEFIGAAWY